MGERLALVTGGTGAVGESVLGELRARGVRAAFTYLKSEARAAAIEQATGQRGVRCDLRDERAIEAALGLLEGEGLTPTVLIHCAAKSRSASLGELSIDDWDEAHAVNCRSAFVLARALARPMREAGGGDVVLVGALDRSQSLPLPAHFAATQGMLAALAMALAKELGPHGTRANMVALGVLDRGLSSELPPSLIADFKAFSALRRLGSPAEAAKVIAWLALENRYLSGKVVPVNGGI